MMRRICQVIATALTAAAYAAPAMASDGGATGCTFQYLNTGFERYAGSLRFDEGRFQVFAIKDGVAAYRDEQGEALAEQPLQFSERAFVSNPGKPGGARIQVKTPGGRMLGWTNRDDVLCRLEPLQSRQTNLLRRMVVRTETAEQGQVRAKEIYPAPLNQCPPSGCLQVSRFQWYFVYHEIGDMVLLAEAAQLRASTSKLLGWLPKSDGIAWNTAAGLRPALEPQMRQGPAGTSGKFICAFRNRADIGQAERCQTVLGGKQWYEIDVRMPILADEGGVYKVAVSPVATGRKANEVNISDLKKIDLYFVVDGSKSMQPVIDSIRGAEGRPGLIERLRKKLGEKLKLGSTLRIGYRIYRDSAKGGADGIENSESLVPSSQSCASNEAEFAASFATVKAQDFPGDNDFPENSFGGLHKVGDDITGCPGHLKIVFLIGDHGYDAAEQTARGHRAHRIEQIVARFKRGVGGLKSQPVVTVIQMPRAIQGVQNVAEYDRAYDLFEKQAKALLEGVVAGSGLGSASQMQPSGFFHRLPEGSIDDAVIERILQPVDQVLQPAALALIQDGINAGESLAQTIARMRNDNRMTVPGLFYDVVLPELCQRLGEQCRSRVIEGVFEAYVPHSPDLETDVILDQRQLNDWIGLLSSFNDVFVNIFRTGTKTREQMVQLYKEALATRFRIIPDDSGPNLQEFVGMRGGLPHGARSPFLAYDPVELRDTRRVVNCEIEHLADYSEKKKRIMEAAKAGTNLIAIEDEPLNQQICPTASAKGQAIRVIRRWSPRPLNVPPRDIRADGTPRYSYKFSKAGTTFYWMNNRYLP